MILPKITYDAGAGIVTLNFSFPPYLKPADDPQEFVRYDSDAYAGQRQSVYFRSDIFKTLQMDFVPDTDMPGWLAFIAYARTGGVWSYYPDATVSAGNIDFTLDDKKWTPVRVPKSTFNKFSLRCRQYVA